MSTRRARSGGVRVPRILFVLATVLGGVAVAALAIPSPSPPAVELQGSLGYRIGYYHERQRRWDLWTMAADGSDKRLLIARPPATDHAPSPDGRLIAFTSHSGTTIRVIRSDGTHKRRLIGPVSFYGHPAEVSSPSWSPDGRQIAFNVYDNEEFRQQIFIANIDGTHIRPLRATFSSWKYDTGPPAWSAAGLIAFSHNNWLWVIRPDGTGLRRLAEGGDDEYSWSPDGGRLARSAGGQIEVIDLATGHQRELECGRFPAWAPTGDKIAFDTLGSCGHPRAEIWVMNSDGTGQQQLTNDQVNDQHPFWLK